jgi:hypothetical protein
MPALVSVTLWQACSWTSSYLTDLHNRSTNTLSRQQLLPSMLMRMRWLLALDHRFALNRGT